MSLTLYFHPLSSFCWKVLVALYESEVPFEGRLVDLGDAAQAAELRALWPLGKFPVLRDEARGQTVPESSVILEYLARYYPGEAPLLPADPDQAREARLRERFFDLYVHQPMQKITGDRLRPAGQNDPQGVAEARALMEVAYGMIDQQMADRRWALGDAFSVVDCAAAPALFYGHKVTPFGAAHRNTAAYLDRLVARPSFARVLREAEPYFRMFPG